MSDQKPPRHSVGERETVQALLQYQRESFVRKLRGVDDASARRRMVGSDTTLLWLARHMAQAEQLWVLVRFAGQEVEPRTDEPREGDTLEDAIDAYERTWRLVDPILEATPLETPCRNPGEDAVIPLRWVMLHLLEETARHAGHADILRELIDGETGR